jgi:hypothetical protein
MIKKSLSILLCISFFLASCKKNDDGASDVKQICSTCDKYILNDWCVADVHCYSGGQISLEGGHIELNKTDLTYRKKYKCRWHSNDAPLGGFPSESKNLTFVDNGKYTYAQDSTYIIFQGDPDTAWLTLAHWTNTINTEDSIFTPAKLDYYESFSINSCRVSGFFTYSLEDLD